MKHLKFLRITFCTVFFLCLFQNIAFAADIRNGENLNLSKNELLKDPYIFGQTLTIDSPVTNDLVAAGEDIKITGVISGNVLAAGKTLAITSPVGGSIRTAGRSVTITGPVERDVVIAAGTVKITKTAHVLGDVMVFGADVTIEGPVRGKVLVKAGTLTINTTIGKSVQASVGSLTLGNKAVINGDLNYSSTQQGVMQNGAYIKGGHNFQKVEAPKKEFFPFIRWGLYKLIADMIVCFVLILFLRRSLTRVVTLMQKNVFRKTSLGLGIVVLGPLVSLIALVFLWLGIFSFLLYIFLILFSLFLTKIFLGFWLLKWWQGRTHKTYHLDYKSAIVGPLTLVLLFSIPIVGLLALFIFYLLALGATAEYLMVFIREEKEFHKNPAS